MLLRHNEPAMLSRQSELTNTERNTKHEKRAQKKLIPSRPNLWMNLHQTPIYHGFCYTHFNMEKHKNTKLTTTVKQVEYVNSLFDEPMFEIDLDKKIFKPVDEERFHQWLDAEKRGGE